MGNVKMVNTVGFGDGLLWYDSKRFKLIMYDVSCSANPVFLLPQKPKFQIPIQSLKQEKFKTKS